jgi:ribosomal protein S18 acetylase RimI-like enzyme
MLTFQHLNLEMPTNQTEEILVKDLIFLSEAWAAEKTCPSYSPNSPSDFLGRDLFLTYDGDNLVGYGLGERKIVERETSYNKVGEKIFELDELYIRPAYRSQGVGQALFQFIEESLRPQVQVLAVTAVSYRYADLLRFYIDELGLTFSYAYLVKRLEEG